VSRIQSSPTWDAGPPKGPQLSPPRRAGDVASAGPFAARTCSKARPARYAGCNGCREAPLSPTLPLHATRPPIVVEQSLLVQATSPSIAGGAVTKPIRSQLTPRHVESGVTTQVSRQPSVVAGLVSARPPLRTVGRLDRDPDAWHSDRPRHAPTLRAPVVQRAGSGAAGDRLLSREEVNVPPLLKLGYSGTPPGSQ